MLNNILHSGVHFSTSQTSIFHIFQQRWKHTICIKLDFKVLEDEKGTKGDLESQMQSDHIRGGPGLAGILWNLMRGAVAQGIYENLSQFPWKYIMMIVFFQKYIKW